MKRLVASAATAAFVIAAMAMGRLITDHVPLEASASEPFVTTGSVGAPVALEYAEVTVTGIRVTPTIKGFTAAEAGGRWLIVDTELLATREPTLMYGFDLVDGQGRRYAHSTRATDCAQNANLATGVRWYGSFCFDVPQDALDSPRFVVSRGVYGGDGSGQRRDGVADIDLEVTSAESDTLWAQTEPLDVASFGFVPPEEVAP